MNIQDLTEIVTNFRDERDWKQFHNPKDGTQRRKNNNGIENGKIERGGFHGYRGTNYKHQDNSEES